MKTSFKGIWRKRFLLILSVLSFSSSCQSTEIKSLALDEDDTTHSMTDQKDDLSLPEHLWGFLKENLNKPTFNCMKASDPSAQDLVGFSKSIIIKDLFKRDPLFKEQSLNTPEKSLLSTFGVPFTELSQNLQQGQQLNPALNSPSSITKHRILISPLARSCGVNGRTLRKFKEIDAAASGIKKRLFTSQDCTKNRKIAHDKQQTYDRAQTIAQARFQRQQQDIAQLAGTTRSSARWEKKCLRLGGTAQAFNIYFEWRKQPAVQDPTRNAMSTFFIENMALFFEKSSIDGVDFYYNTSDINPQLQDDHNPQRSNFERLQQQLNPVYIDEQGELKIFEWHHFTQEQQSLGSIVVLIPQEIHENPFMHPFNGEGSQINRKTFNLLKRQANSQISTILSGD